MENYILALDKLSQNSFFWAWDLGCRLDWISPLDLQHFFMDHYPNNIGKSHDI